MKKKEQIKVLAEENARLIKLCSLYRDRYYEIIVETNEIINKADAELCRLRKERTELINALDQARRGSE